MNNLPANQASASMPSSPERAEHREWIGGCVATLLAHYWRDDDPLELTAAIGADWADVLEGIPREYIRRASIAYQRQEPRRRPTPGAIYQLARAEMPSPVVVRVPREDPARVPCSPAVADAICAAAGFQPRRFGGLDAE